MSARLRQAVVAARDLDAVARPSATSGCAELEDMVEAHLHPSDIGGAIVSVSQPSPPSAWRWDGPDWETRAAPLTVAGASVGVPDPRRWRAILGDAECGVSFGSAEGLTEIVLRGVPASPRAIELGRVRVVVSHDCREEMT